MANHYEILGVARDATTDELRRAYRRAAFRLHPDRAAGGDAAMVRLNEAWDTLKDAGRRAAYDRTLRDPSAHPAGRARPRRPAAASPAGLDPLEFKLRVFLPLDAALTKALAALDAAVEELAYDVYDDRHVERFAEAVEAAGEALALAHDRLLGAPWPDALASGLNLYRQAVRQAQDAVEDYAGFVDNYDSDLVVEGRDLLRWAERMLAEARAHLGA